MVAEYPSVRWIQTVAASVATDTRAVNAAVILLASTFGYQTIEYQEKAVQFFSQTMLSITAAPQKGQQSMSSVFAGASQEEEKRRKERKNNAVVSIVLAALSAIVAALPCEPGETLVTVWGQMVVDRLCELLAHSNAGALVGQRLAHGLYGGSSACDAPRNHPPPPSHHHNYLVLVRHSQHRRQHVGHLLPHLQRRGQRRQRRRGGLQRLGRGACTLVS